jgi:ribokinase
VDLPVISPRLVPELRLVVIGAYVTDCIVRTPQLPVWGEEYEARSVHTSPGGKALNQAVALARLGSQVTAVGVVGGDGGGRDVLGALEREGIDASYVECRDNVSTAVCICLVSDAGENAIVWHIDDDVALTVATVHRASPALEAADAVLITFEMPARAIHEAISRASNSHSLVIVQPAPSLIDRAAARSLPWDLVDVLVSNEGEARALIAPGQQAVPARQLAGMLSAELGVSTVVVTLGASGCVAHAERSSTLYSADEVVAVDTTGAGDAFAATFAAYVATGSPVAEAVNAGQSAAARAIQRVGARESMPARSSLG